MTSMTTRSQKTPLEPTSPETPQVETPQLPELLAAIAQYKNEIQELTTKSQIQTGNYADLLQQLQDLTTHKEPTVATPSILRVLSDAIPILQNAGDLSTIENFNLRCEALLSALYPEDFMVNGQALAYVTAKLCNVTLKEFSVHEPPLSNWQSVRNWLLTRRNLVLDSDFAKEDLRLQSQVAMKMSAREYFDHLQTISCRIAHHSEREADLRNAFARSLDPRIRNKVVETHDLHKMSCATAGLPVTNEWLISMATVFERNIQHTPTSTSRASISVVATKEVPMEYRKGPLSDAGRLFLQQNGGCYFCRELGHIIPACARFKQFKATHPDK